MTGAIISSFLHAILLMVSIYVGFSSTFWVGFAVFLTGAFILASAKSKVLDAQFEKAQQLINLHAKELTVRRAQLTVRMNYGLLDDKKWQKEIDFFLGRVIRPAVGEIDILEKNYKRVRDAIETATSNYQQAVAAFSPNISPVEYEQMVATMLSDAGWVTRLTSASGDQGVDVVAEKGGIKLVVQCKLYSKPVGNAAVQEAIAGRSFEQADHAAVVSNIGFTRSAKQLASASNVFLLHHDQLGDLDAMFSGVYAQPQRLTE